MTEQHTPGPWKIGHSFTDEPAIREPGGQCVGVVCNSPFEYEEYLANARLFAAAPELLEALEAMIADELAPDEIATMAVNAINKAKGI